MDRRGYLLGRAKDALEEGRIPLSEAFILDNDVVPDEAFDLADDMATAIELYQLTRERVGAAATRIRGRAKGG